MYKEERRGLEIRKMDECEMDKFRFWYTRYCEKTIAIQGDRWPQTGEQKGDKIGKTFHSNIWEITTY